MPPYVWELKILLIVQVTKYKWGKIFPKIALFYLIPLIRKISTTLHHTLCPPPLMSLYRIINLIYFVVSHYHFHVSYKKINSFWYSKFIWHYHKSLVYNKYKKEIENKTFNRFEKKKMCIVDDTAVGRKGCVGWSGAVLKPIFTLENDACVIVFIWITIKTTT